MASLKYFDAGSGTYKDIYGLPGPSGPTGPTGSIGVTGPTGPAYSTQIGYGASTIGPGSVEGDVELAVTFSGVTFTAAPRVVATPTSTTYVYVGVKSVTTTGFILMAHYTGPEWDDVILPQTVVNWIAIGV